MKLSYQNISILADLFEEVKFYQTSDNEMAFIKISNKIRLFIDPLEIHGRGQWRSGKYGKLTFTEETTVNDFKALCAHLGVELVEKKSHPCKHCGQPESKHQQEMCPTQFTFYIADLEE